MFRLCIPAVAAVLSLLSFGPPAAADQGDAINFVAGTRVVRDDNVFRLPDGLALLGQRGDTQHSLYAGARFDWTYGRQRLRAEARFNRVRYERFGFLDYDGTDLDAAWLWQLGNRWQGELGVERRRVLTDFADITLAANQQPVGNLTTTQRVRASANHWFHPDWSVQGGLSATRVTNSAAFRRANDFSGVDAEVGLLQRRGNGNELGLKYRRTAGTYVNRVVIATSVVDNGYRQDDLEATALWLLSGHSRVSARGGYTSRRHDELPQRDFRGLTGRLTYDWLIDGKSALAVSLRREIGNSDYANAAYADVRALAIVPTWTPTAKTSLQGRYEHRAVDYRGDPGIVVTNAVQREDRIAVLGLTASYQPWRFLQLTLGVQQERRRSNDPALPYRDRLGYLAAELTF